MNSTGVVRMMHAARKAGVTSVPLNYRLTPEEAAYIVDDSDAVAVYADAEFAAHFAQVRPHTPKVKHWLVFGGHRRRPPADMVDVDALVAAASDATPSRRLGQRERSHDDLHVGHDRASEGRRALRRRRSRPAAPADRLHRLRARRRLSHHRAALSLGPRRLHVDRARARQHRRAAAQVRRRGLAAAGADAPRDDDLLGADADPPGLPAPRRGEGALRPLVDAAHDRQRGALVVRAEGDVHARLRRRLALGGLRLHRARRRHDPAAGGPAPEAGLVRACGARRRGRALRRGREPRREAARAGRALRPLALARSAPTTRRRRSSRGAGAATGSRSATSRTSTRRRSSTSATARTT